MIEATGKAGTSIKPDGKAGIGQGFTVASTPPPSKARATGAAFTVWQGKAIAVSAPRARLHDLVRAS